MISPGSHVSFCACLWLSMTLALSLFRIGNLSIGQSISRKKWRIHSNKFNCCNSAYIYQARYRLQTGKFVVRDLKCCKNVWILLSILCTTQFVNGNILFYKLNFWKKRVNVPTADTFKSRQDGWLRFCVLG